MEEWTSLESLGYPDYSVSSYGRISHNRYRRILAQSMNTTGHMKVGLLAADGSRSTLSVARLVATCFVPGHSPAFDTPIHLDGNKEHTFAENLAWRPRWFAVRYHQQFTTPQVRAETPIVELTTDTQYEDSLHAAIAFGVLERDVVTSTIDHSAVFPHDLKFRLLDQ